MRHDTLTTIVFITIGAAGIGHGLMRWLTRSTTVRRAFIQVIAGFAILLGQAAAMAAPGESLRQVLSLANTLVLATALVLLGHDTGATRIREGPREGSGN